MKIKPLLAATLLPLIQACANTAPAAGNTAPSLQPGLQPLAGFLGARHCSGSFLKSGKAISSTETMSTELSGRWLTLRHDDEPPFAFHALELWGYDATAGRFVAYMYDGGGGMREFTSPGWEGDSFTWTNVDTSAPKRDRFVFDRGPQGAYRFTYEVSADGNTWSGVDNLTCKAK